MAKTRWKLKKTKGVRSFLLHSWVELIGSQFFGCVYLFSSSAAPLSTMEDTTMLRMLERGKALLKLIPIETTYSQNLPVAMEAYEFCFFITGLIKHPEPVISDLMEFFSNLIWGIFAICYFFFSLPWLILDPTKENFRIIIRKIQRTNCSMYRLCNNYKYKNLFKSQEFLKSLVYPYRPELVWLFPREEFLKLNKLPSHEECLPTLKRLNPEHKKILFISHKW